MDGGAWKAAVHGVTKSRTWLSDFTFTFHFHALEKEMATHSSVLAWRIPWSEKPGRLQSTGSQRVGHDWSDLAAAAAGRTKEVNHSLGLNSLHPFFSLLTWRVQFLFSKNISTKLFLQYPLYLSIKILNYHHFIYTLLLLYKYTGLRVQIFYKY